MYKLWHCTYYRTSPEYYDSVKNPIDLLKVQQKLKTDEYEEIEQLTEDINLLISNAKSFYAVGWFDDATPAMCSPLSTEN